MILTKKMPSIFTFSVLLLPLLFLLATPQQLQANSAGSTALLNQGNNLYYMENKPESSYSYYQMAAEQGNVLARAQIAKMLFIGAGVPLNKARAEELFAQVLPGLESAANAGDPFAQYLYAYYLQNGYYDSVSPAKTAFIWYERSANQGNPVAQNNLANCYLNGDGVPLDKGAAIALYKKAAQAGNPVAQSNLAGRYHDGDGVPQNLNTAASWYQKAAEKGIAEAQYQLGIMYRDGTGVSQNIYTAEDWLIKAAEQNHVEAQEQLGLLIENLNDTIFMTDEEKHELAIKWYQKAADNGSEFAQKKIDAYQQQKSNTLMNEYVEYVKRNAENNEDAIRATNLINDFRFPGSECSEPDFPSDFPSNSEIKRLTKKIDKFYRCLQRSADKDRRAIKNLIVEIGGDFDENSDGSFSWSVPNRCNCEDAMVDLVDEYDARTKNRRGQAESVEGETDYLNERIRKHNFWQGIENSINGH